MAKATRKNSTKSKGQPREGLDLIDASRSLVERDPDVGALVLECANMPPYAAAIARALRIPVYDWYSMVCWFAQGLRPRLFFASDDHRPPPTNTVLAGYL